MKKTILMICASAGIVFFSACNETNKRVEDQQDVAELASADTAVMYGDEKRPLEADGAEIKEVGEGFWANVDFEAPTINDPDLSNSGIEARSGEGYNVYTMDERVLFDLDKATLRSGADDKLKSVAESINELGNQGQIRIYGYTDAQGSKDYNKQLAEERANTVKDWLQNNADIDASRLSIQPVGEANPRATNETAEGRQKNRRVAIAVATNQQQQQAAQ
ncbi:OmpA family protein [Pontibacter silvestris]|uniref:OmpA family protein n=1 Tax=Pontibacter silvestris TaxID=2305183 RepID=A0ABW4X0U2_9BACT|nr:OmpA family protein [Pontibacter silvestris]MCC9135750.1 OmpA family protein [Pontibacter silvestris]